MEASLQEHGSAAIQLHHQLRLGQQCYHIPIAAAIGPYLLTLQELVSLKKMVTSLTSEPELCLHLKSTVASVLVVLRFLQVVLGGLLTRCGSACRRALHRCLQASF
jgi:hypothetical protein